MPKWESSTGRYRSRKTYGNKSVRSELFDANYSMRIVRCESFDANCSMRIVRSKLFDPNCSIRIVRSELFDRNCSIPIVRSELFDPNYSNNSIQIVQILWIVSIISKIFREFRLRTCHSLYTEFYPITLVILTIPNPIPGYEDRSAESHFPPESKKTDIGSTLSHHLSPQRKHSKHVPFEYDRHDCSRDRSLLSNNPHERYVKSFAIKHLCLIPWCPRALWEYHSDDRFSLSRE